MQKIINYIDKSKKTNMHFHLYKRTNGTKSPSRCLPFIFCIFTFFLVLFSKDNFLAASEGLKLWANNIVPSLLPFFIATELLSYTDIVHKLSKLLNPIMKPIFNVPGCGAYAFIMGIISGYPTGAKIVTTFHKNNLVTTAEAERLLSFTNNSGPLFIVATVGISMFGNALIGILLFITHILACISVGFIFRFWKYNNNNNNNSLNLNSNSNFKAKNTTYVTFSNLGEVLSNSILSSINTIVMIGGFVVLFSVILSILENSKILEIASTAFLPFFKVLSIPNLDFAKGALSGIFEVTNGVKQISTIFCKKISVNISICSFLLGFGGLSVLLQVLSIISKSDISIKPYIFGKCLQAIFAFFYTILFINLFPIFNLNL